MTKFFSQLKKNLKQDFSNFSSIKVAILGDTPTQLLSQALRGTGYDISLDLEIWEADYSQIDAQIFDNNSDLYQYNPEIIIIFQSTQKLLYAYNNGEYAEQTELTKNRLA